MHLNLLQQILIWKTTEVTGDLIGNKIAEKVTGTASRSAPKTALQKDKKSIEIPKDTYHKKKDDILLTKFD